MEWDILKKEREYHKENELIESRTRALLQKVDDAMKMQENILKDSQAKLDIPNKITAGKIKKEMVQIPNLPEVYLDDPNVPGAQILNDMGQKGMHNFYRTKIKALREECDKLHAEMKNKNMETNQLRVDLDQLAEEKEKWLLQYNLGKSQISKLENQLSALSCKTQSKDNENAAIKKEVDGLKREIKILTQNLSTNEIKLNKVLEENEKNKALLKSFKKEEKDLKDCHKKQINELTSTIQQIEKNKCELLHGFRKQMQLIDNLKKQRTHLENFNLVQMAEADFMKILDWKGDH